MINYQLGFLIAVFSFTYTNILTDIFPPLNWIYRVLYHLFGTDERAKMGLEPHWFFKIIIFCEKCNAGQIALWSFLWINRIDFIIDPVQTICKLILFISFTIFTTLAIKLIYTKLQTNN